MSDGAIIHVDTEAARTRAQGYLGRCPFGWVVTIRPPTRTDLQNKLMWPLLTEISKQVHTHGVIDPPETWKEKFMHALGYECIMTTTLDGERPLPIGRRTSKLSIADFCDLIELIYQFGAEKGVTFREKAKTREEVKDAISPKNALGRAA